MIASTSGARASPFVGHQNVLGMEVVLRVMCVPPFSLSVLLMGSLSTLIIPTARFRVSTVDVVGHEVVVAGVNGLVADGASATVVFIAAMNGRRLDEPAVLLPLSHRQPGMSSPCNAGQRLPPRGRGGSGAVPRQVKCAPRRPCPATAAIFDGHAVTLRHAEAVPLLLQPPLLKSQSRPWAPFVAHGPDELCAQMASQARAASPCIVHLDPVVLHLLSARPPRSGVPRPSRGKTPRLSGPFAHGDRYSPHNLRGIVEGGVEHRHVRWRWRRVSRDGTLGGLIGLCIANRVAAKHRIGDGINVHVRLHLADALPEAQLGWVRVRIPHDPSVSLTRA